MKHLTYLKTLLQFLLVAVVLSNCRPERNHTKILYFSPQSNPAIEEALEEVSAASGWQIERVSDLQSFTDDSLQAYSTVILTFT